MCMQDLAIARRLVARRVANLELLASGTVRIPGNIRRVAIAVSEGDSPRPLYLSDPEVQDGPPLNISVLAPAGEGVSQVVLTAHSHPGIVTSDLYAVGSITTIVVYETVPDAELDAAITLLAAHLTRRS